MGSILTPLGFIWDLSKPSWCLSWPILGPSGTCLGSAGAIWGLSWPNLGATIRPKTDGIPLPGHHFPLPGHHFPLPGEAKWPPPPVFFKSGGGKSVCLSYNYQCWPIVFRLVAEVALSCWILDPCLSFPGPCKLPCWLTLAAAFIKTV